MKLNFNKKYFLRIALIIFGAYTALLLVNLPSVYYFNAQKQQPTDLRTLTTSLVWGMYLWVFITPFILWAGYVFRIARPNLWRNVLIHLTVGILIGFIRPLIDNFGLWMLSVNSLETFQSELFKTATYIRSVTGAVVTYPTVIGIQQAYLYFRESQERAFRLQQAELEMLKSQLQPHFLFNALNAISALVYKSPKDADQTITQLSDLLRISLSNGKTHEVTLKVELEFLKSYLRIQQTLMKQRLQINFNIDPETLDALIPNMILQPIAENSIKHGLAPLEEGGRIEISAVRRNGTLHLEMSDNGMGIGEKESVEGIGLSNTRARLKHLYGDKCELKFLAPESGGLSVKIEIPFREWNEM